MDHNDAINLHAVDRYLRGDLEDHETADFEEHMFECPTCAQQVTLGLEILTDRYRVFDRDEDKPKRRFCRTFLRREGAR